MDSTGRLSQDEFIVLIARHERRVRGFVATLVRKRECVDEVVQQACLTAWKKIETFVRVEGTVDRDFARWLCTIARFEALAYVRKNQGSRLLFDSELVEKLADLQLNDEKLEDRQEALQSCIKKTQRQAKNPCASLLPSGPFGCRDCRTRWNNPPGRS